MGMMGWRYVSGATLGKWEDLNRVRSTNIIAKVRFCDVDSGRPIGSQKKNRSGLLRPGEGGG